MKNIRTFTHINDKATLLTNESKADDFVTHSSIEIPPHTLHKEPCDITRVKNIGEGDPFWHSEPNGNNSYVSPIHSFTENHPNTEHNQIEPNYNQFYVSPNHSFPENYSHIVHNQSENKSNEIESYVSPNNSFPENYSHSVHNQSESEPNDLDYYVSPKHSFPENYSHTVHSQSEIDPNDIDSDVSPNQSLLENYSHIVYNQSENKPNDIDSYVSPNQSFPESYSNTVHNQIKKEPNDIDSYVSQKHSFTEAHSHKVHNRSTSAEIHQEKDEKEKWKEYDIEFSKIVTSIQHKLETNQITPKEAAKQFNNTLTRFLESKKEIKTEVKTFYKHNPKSMQKISEAKKLKNHLEKKAKQKLATKEDKSLACQAVRHYSFLLEKKKSIDEADEKRKQEKEYSNNFHKFAKEVTEGRYGKKPQGPTYSREDANIYYKEKYSTEVTVDFTELEWFPEAPEPTTPYNLEPYTEDNIKEALEKKNPTSAPGDDHLLYGYLTKLPHTHEFLSTLFTRIRDTSEPPTMWSESKVILITKSEETDTDNPSDFRMIALTANVAKLFHSMESSRSINYMITNGYLDPSAQKAYIQGINGCVEHVQVVQEVIQHAKANNRTVHITWFDLIDAFGSLSHMLIPHVLRHYHFPSEIINYIQNIYSKLKGRIVIHSWESEVFEFLKGLFQGDPYSGTIFLIVFNPLMEYIKKHKDKQGYTIKVEDENEDEEPEEPNETSVITTPFADDFNLISRNKKLHQKLITDIASKAKTMGLEFKSSKCRSLSIQNGQSTDVTFVMQASLTSDMITHIQSVHKKPHKFLGSTVTYTSNPQDYSIELKAKLKTKLENIESSKVRGEHKLAIYERYALPSMRYHLSIHDLHETHLNELDKVSRTFIKKWLDIPPRGVTDVGLYHPYLLNIKQPSQLYLEGHASNTLLMRMKGDKNVNVCLDSKLKREKKWKKKSSTAVKVNNMIVNLVENGKVQFSDTRNTRLKYIKAGKVAVKKSIKDEVKDKWNERVRDLTLQGDFAQLLIEEEESVTWQSIARNLPRNVLSFATRLATNSLASPDNLKRWGKRKMGVCPLCSSLSCTLAHISNMCTVALKQGRFTWRHDSVLFNITTHVKNLATEETEVFADMEGSQINGGTIPADILVSGGKGSKPDLVIINRKQKTIALMELTCTLPNGTENASKRKQKSYTDLAIALEEKGFKVSLMPFEVCSNGHITSRNKKNIENTLKIFNIRVRKELFVNLSKISLLCTMSIFYAYQVKEWISPPLLTP